MLIAQPSTVGAFTSMNTVDLNDSVDTSIWQTSGKESLLPFSRAAGESPGQLFHLFNVLEQPELPGWPLLTPLRAQMHKCQKCSREFCAPINYRRHVRVHRRSLNVDKDSHKIRDALAAFWDKLSPEKAKDVVSFEDVTLKDIPGSAVMIAWATSYHKPGVWTLPQDYVRSGSMLLEIIQAKPSKLPISSQELFGILDDASERTFLCGGTAESVQNYVFDGEVARVALELRNLVACISFLLEQKLVKAWVADKDAEALRCQKLLVEEEEAAQKRLAELIEKKNRRKLRKEQKSKEQSAIPLKESIMVEEVSQSTPSSSNSNSDARDTSADVLSIEKLDHISDNGNYVDAETQIDQIECLDSKFGPHAEPPPTGSSRVRRQWLRKSQKNRRNGFHEGQNLEAVHPEPSQKLNKVWTKKFRMENNDEALNYRSEDEASLPDVNKSEVIIGSISISVPVRSHISRRNDIGLKDALSDTTQKKCEDSKEESNPDNLQSAVYNEPERPLNGNETRAQMPIQNVLDSESDIVSEIKDSSLHKKSRECFPWECLPSLSESMISRTPGSVLSSFAAKDFLARRWKEAISADHTKLVLSPEPGETPGGSTEEETTAANVYERANISRTNLEKGEKSKYTPKQKVAA